MEALFSVSPLLRIEALANLPRPALLSLVGLLGLILGSFLNVVIHRLPIMMAQEEANYIAALRGEPLPHPLPYNLFMPRSACPKCGTQITALQNIPVISYLLLGRKCSHCKTAIPLHYPLVELFACLLTVAVFVRFGATWQAVAASGLVLVLLALTVIDAHTQCLPDQLTLPLVWAGLFVNLFGWFVPLQDAVIGAMAGYVFLWAVYCLFKLLRGKEGMGYGDFKLMAALGAWMGWHILPAAILLSSIVGAIYGIAMLCLGRLGHETPFAFGPFIAGAGLLILLVGHKLPFLVFF